MSEVLPRRRSELIVEELKNETVVYDPGTDRMHCLNPAAAIVFSFCDGATSRTKAARGIAGQLGGAVDTRLVDIALARLARARLLDPAFSRPAMSRREATKALGLTGALSALMPIVISVVAPTPASAQSCLPKFGCCTSNSQCCSGSCGVGGGPNHCTSGACK